MISKKVFIASDTFIAFIDRAHGKHLHASACFRYFAQEKYTLYTSLLSINKTYEVLFENISHSLARDFLKALSLGNMNIIYPEESDIKNTFKLFSTEQSTELTFSKGLMAVLCNKRNIPQICTFDYMPQLFGLQLFYLPI